MLVDREFASNESDETFSAVAERGKIHGTTAIKAHKGNHTLLVHPTHPLLNRAEQFAAEGFVLLKPDAYALTCAATCAIAVAQPGGATFAAFISSWIRENSPSSSQMPPQVGH